MLIERQLEKKATVAWRPPRNGLRHRHRGRVSLRCSPSPVFSSCDELQSLHVPDVDIPALELQSPGFLEFGNSTGRGHTLGADHRPQLLVSVADGYLVTFAGHDPLA